MWTFAFGGDSSDPAAPRNTAACAALARAEPGRCRDRRRRSNLHPPGLEGLSSDRSVIKSGFREPPTPNRTIGLQALKVQMEA